MPANWLIDSEKRRLTEFPAAFSENDVVTFFTLIENNSRRLKKLHNNVNRLGFAPHQSSERNRTQFLHRQIKFTT
jgi:hypothetical protein